MTVVQELARFTADATFEQISEEARRQLQVRVLDALACALGALDSDPVRRLREHVDDFGGAPTCSLIGGGRVPPDRAALYNGFLVRYLDFNDSYLAPGETCHPSDNLAAVLAAAESADAGGKDFLTALAVAYQVQCRLSDEAPVRAKGFDHTTQGAYSVAAGAARALGLDPERTAHAIAISGTANNALRVTRTGALSHWKGLAFPNTAAAGVHATFLARRGITGPPEVFEGNKGFMDAIAGPFTIDWAAEDLERVRRTILKRFNAEVHSQATLEAALALREELLLGPVGSDEGVDPKAIASIRIETFDVAHDIIGGGEEGEKTTVRTKEEADHSLPYMTAVMLLDGQVMPAQYRPERITASDVQGLLRKVRVEPVEAYSRRFPGEMPCRLSVTLSDRAGGATLTREVADYEGFHTRPMSWDTVVEKLERLATHGVGAGQGRGRHRDGAADRTLRREIVQAVDELPSIQVATLTGLLARAG